MFMNFTPSRTTSFEILTNFNPGKEQEGGIVEVQRAARLGGCRAGYARRRRIAVEVDIARAVARHALRRAGGVRAWLRSDGEKDDPKAD